MIDLLRSLFPKNTRRQTDEETDQKPAPLPQEAVKTEPDNREAPQGEGLYPPWAALPPRGVSPILEGLAPEQQEAVDTRHRYALVYAGPGAGKTLVLVRRAAWMVESLEVPPGDIALITFTRKAAGEMRSRLDAQLGGKAGAIFVGTFHSYALHLLQSAGLDLGELLTEEEAVKRFAKALEAVRGTKVGDMEAGRVMGVIGRKLGLGQRLSPEEGAAYSLYQEEKEREGKLDFEDLLNLPLQHKGALLRARPHLLVDEYQDSNWGQLRLIRATAETLFAVGDPKQSIYGWRGADPSLILRFEEHFPGAKVYTLSLNHRSARRVVEVADAFIAALPGAEDIPKGQKAVQPELGSVAFLPSANPEEDIRLATEAVAALTKRYPLSAIAVLYRSRSPKGFPVEKKLSEALFAANVPQGHPEPLGKQLEYKIFFSLVELALFPQNPSAARRLGEVRVLPMEIRQALKETGTLPKRTYTSKGQALLEVYRGLKEMVGDISGMLPLLEGPALVEAISITKERLAAALAVAQTLRDLFVETLEKGGGNLLDFFDTLWERAGGVYPSGVATLTAHASKGLEWPAVVVLGVRDGFFPASGSLTEEGFLLYVAMTRARETLVLVGDPHSRFGRLLPPLEGLEAI